MIIIFILANMLMFWLGYKFGSRVKKIRLNQNKY